VLVEKPDGRFEGPICGLCPPDLEAVTASDDASDLPESDDWSVLLAHPFTDQRFGTAFGSSPADLRDALQHEVGIRSVPKFREAAVRLWKGRLQPRWLDDRRVELERAVRLPDKDWSVPPSDFLIAAWHRHGRWLQLLRGERTFALRTSFAPRCGPTSAEQAAAALALAGELLRGVPADLCRQAWTGGGENGHVAAGLPYRYGSIFEPSEWPLSMKIWVEDDKVVLSFWIPEYHGGHFGPPKPPWFARKVAFDDALDE